MFSYAVFPFAECIHLENQSFKDFGGRAVWTIDGEVSEVMSKLSKPHPGDVPVVFPDKPEDADRPDSAAIDRLSAYYICVWSMLV